MQNAAAATTVVDPNEKSALDVQENSTAESQLAADKTDEAYVEDATPGIDRKAERKLVRKQDLIILPLLGLGYLMGVLVCKDSNLLVDFSRLTLRLLVGSKQHRQRPPHGYSKRSQHDEPAILPSSDGDL